MRPVNEALILVDLQYDFLPTGFLPVPDGDAVIPLANQLMPLFQTVVATQDLHPANHGSFAANHPWRKPGQLIDLHGLDHSLWPIHCVQNSFGAELVSELDQSRITKIFQKGTDPTVDSYSGFFDNGHRNSTGMSDWLKAQGVDTLFVMGLATDYCVKFTVLDGLSEGFKVNWITDACRGDELNLGDIELAIQAGKEAGAELKTMIDIIA